MEGMAPHAIVAAERPSNKMHKRAFRKAVQTAWTACRSQSMSQQQNLLQLKLSLQQHVELHTFCRGLFRQHGRHDTPVTPFCTAICWPRQGSDDHPQLLQVDAWK